MTVPWQAKIIAKIILTRLPFQYSFWKKIGIFNHGSMDDSDYAINVFNKHLKKTNMLSKLKGKVVLELGPGDSIATALLCYANGCRAILVDSGNYVKKELDSYTTLIKKLKIAGLPVPDISKSKNIDDILESCNAKYYTNGLQDLKKIDSSSVHFIFSQAVLEHIRKKEFVDTIIETKRILKPNGICSHEIDLRDHLNESLNNLRFSEKLWESNFFAKSGFYTNRIQFKQMIRIFEKQGFDVNLLNVKKWNKLPINENSLDTLFVNIELEEDLLVKVFEVFLTHKKEI